MDAFLEEDPLDRGESDPLGSSAGGGAGGAGGDPGAGQPGPLFNKDVETLFRRWRNEKFAPELLRFDTDVVEALSEVVEFVAEGLEEEKADGEGADAGGGDPHYLLRCVDMDRVKYLLRDYLRIRLWKLRRWPQHYLEPSNLEFLSKAERTIVVKDYWELKKQFLDNKFLSGLPILKQKLDDKVDLLDMTRRPDLDKNVYVRIVGEVDPIEVTPSTTQGVSATQRSTVPLNKGDTYLLRYQQVRHFFTEPEHDGKLVLV